MPRRNSNARAPLAEPPAITSARLLAAVLSDADCWPGQTEPVTPGRATGSSTATDSDGLRGSPQRT